MSACDSNLNFTMADEQNKKVKKTRRAGQIIERGGDGQGD
jgi:hypothetical protein